jgi:hypothetical protein
MNRIVLQDLLSQTSDRRQRTTSFALLCLGLVESLASGSVSAADAIRIFFHAENCQFVSKQLRNKAADRLMSHGTQLADLFDALPIDEAQREFQRELATMHALCLKLLEDKQRAA